MTRNYCRRYPQDYGFIRTLYITLFLWLVVYPAGILFYTTKIDGRENLEKGMRYVFTSNHTSYIDAPLLSMVANHPVAYMAKEELYTHKNPLIRFLVISLGSFGVNRKKPESATIKSIIDIARHTKWSFGIFPQGKTYSHDEQNFDEVKGGFVSIAKLAKMDIVPVAISGFDGYAFIPFSKHITLNIGKPISYQLPEDEILKQWVEYMKENVE
ncbi:MAG: 1-acyl-sn-glycerol-3-phosphate acyltransferase [Cyanobacteria bacterium SIG29]|nr:1-acyl-sn-glycerol-3-phosphate acyltransferase [Cyanobacteria bacterium SIG29]